MSKVFGIFSSSSGNLLITEADTWPGFYASWAAVKQGSFSKVVCAVKSPTSDLSKELSQLGAKVVEYDPTSLENVKSIMSNVDTIVFIPVHTENTIECSKNIIRAAEQNKSINKLIMWSKIGTGLVSETPFSQRQGSGTPKNQPFKAAGSGSDDSSYKLIFSKLLEVESIVRNSNIQKECILRIGFPMQALFSMSNVIQSRGIFPLPSSTGKMAPVNAKDIGLATVKLLQNNNLFDKHNKQTVVLTGPQSLTGLEIVDKLNSALQAPSPVEFSETDIPTIKSILEKQGSMDTHELNLLLGWFTLLKEGKLDITTNDLRDIVSEPTKLETFFKENPASFKPRGLLTKLVIDELTRT